MNDFSSDYSYGAHPRVLEKLAECNQERCPGYGFDQHSKKAEEIILKSCGLDDKSQVHFFAGGTLANKVLLDIVLESYQAVLASDLAHIFSHESGAIEALGHKILPIANMDGKISAQDVDVYMQEYNKSDKKIHIAAPGAVYITQPTEIGTLYSKKELKALAKVCKKHSLLLYVDGSRLAYALGSDANDLSLEDIASCADALCIGGAKCGGLLGEAGVIKNSVRAMNFRTFIKRHGALIAKSRVVAVQFEALFEDDLYTKIGKKAVEIAIKIYYDMKKMGYKFLTPVQTNQCFVILDDKERKAFAQNGFEMGIWDTISGYDVSRIVTDCFCQNEDVQRLLSIAARVKENNAGQA